MASNLRTIAILTGGGDVPGLNPAIRAITIRALREGFRVVGVRRGWAGLVDYVPGRDHDNSENVQELSEAEVNRAGRTGGTFLHTSSTSAWTCSSPSAATTRSATPSGCTTRACTSWPSRRPWTTTSTAPTTASASARA